MYRITQYSGDLEMDTWVTNKYYVINNNALFFKSKGYDVIVFGPTILVEEI